MLKTAWPGTIVEPKAEIACLTQVLHDAVLAALALVAVVLAFRRVLGYLALNLRPLAVS